MEERISEIKNKIRELRNKESKVEIVSQEDFDNAHKEFEEIEKRGSLYPLFLKLMNRGDKLEAYLFILATWNFAGFRYLIRNFDINKFSRIIDELEPVFDKFKEQDVRMIKFDEFDKETTEIYNTFSNQVKSVGATKIMHLRAPEVFVLWDRRIREYYGFKNDSAESYIKFLKRMQEKFKNMKLKDNNRTFAKAIDEYNYIRITEPLIKLEKELKKLKEELKKLK